MNDYKQYKGKERRISLALENAIIKYSNDNADSGYEEGYNDAMVGLYSEFHNQWDWNSRMFIDHIKMQLPDSVSSAIENGTYNHDEE